MQNEIEQILQDSDHLGCKVVQSNDPNLDTDPLKGLPNTREEMSPSVIVSLCDKK